MTTNDITDYNSIDMTSIGGGFIPTTYTDSTWYPSTASYTFCNCNSCRSRCRTETEIAEMQKLALAIDATNENEPLPDLLSLLKMARERIRELEKTKKTK